MRVDATRVTGPGDGQPDDRSAGPDGDDGHGSFGEFLRELQGLFPPALVSGSGWDRLLALARRLPIHVIDRRFGFEFDLFDPDPVADFCVVPSPGTRLAEFYVRRGELASPSSAEAALGTFLAKSWANAPPAGFPAQGEGDVILEYDLAGMPAERPTVPGIFIVPLDDSSREGLFGEPERLAAALWAVAGWTPDEAILRQMQRVYRRMAPPARVSQAGILPGRPQRAIRLILRAESGEGAVELLERLDWAGSLADVATAYDSLSELTRPGVSLSVDVTTQGVSRRLGLELFRPTAWHELDRTGWNLLIDRLEDQGWCLPEKALGLKAWPRMEQAFDRAGAYRILQSINHVKVVLDRGTTTAKAYAGAIVLKSA
ncbi:MAG: hypothetical protein OXE75_15860 [bacterium]|nr:hypothetical protein [bacterium]